MKHRRRKAFTLLELLAVMLILSILVGLVVGVTRYGTAQVYRTRTLVIMDIVGQAIHAYYDDTDAYPGRLSQLPDNPKAMKVLLNLHSETFMKDKEGHWVIYDAYGELLTYNKKGGLGDCPVVVSCGPDGHINTEDDIRSDKR